MNIRENNEMVRRYALSLLQEDTTPDKTNRIGCRPLVEGTASIRSASMKRFLAQLSPRFTTDRMFIDALKTPGISWDDIFGLIIDTADNVFYGHTQSDILSMLKTAKVSPKDIDYIMDSHPVSDLEQGEVDYAARTARSSNTKGLRTIPQQRTQIPIQRRPAR